MIASPSSPSVRLTALLKPTMNKKVTTTWNMPSGKARSLKYGISRDVLISSEAIMYRATAAMSADADCQNSF